MIIPGASKDCHIYWIIPFMSVVIQNTHSLLYNCAVDIMDLYTMFSGNIIVWKENSSGLYTRCSLVSFHSVPHLHES